VINEFSCEKPKIVGCISRKNLDSVPIGFPARLFFRIKNLAETLHYSKQVYLIFIRSY